MSRRACKCRRCRLKRSRGDDPCGYRSRWPSLVGRQSLVKAGLRPPPSGGCGLDKGLRPDSYATNRSTTKSARRPSRKAHASHEFQTAGFRPNFSLALTFDNRAGRQLALESLIARTSFNTRVLNQERRRCSRRPKRPCPEKSGSDLI